METLTIVNANPHEFQYEHCDFSLPANYYFYGPIVMLNSQIKPKPSRKIIEITGDKTIRETYISQGFGMMDGGIIGVKINSTTELPHPMEYIPGGYNHSNNIIVPDHIKWGELFRWCMDLENLCQTELFPVAAAPKAEIEAFLTKMLKDKGR